MNTWLARCLMGSLILSAPALAQDEDDPYAYPDDEPARTEESEDDRPRRREVDETDSFREAAEEEDGESGDFERLSRLDDPNTGLAFELIGGMLLLDSSSGEFSRNRPGFGVRATWEFGRMLDGEPLREALWADLRWTYGGYTDGTDFIMGSTNLHYFTVAPAYELKLGQSAFGFYAQAGGGVAYQSTSITVDNESTPVSGLQPVLQYGVGFRGRPQPGRMAVSFRLEATGFRRGYSNDFFLGGSAGIAF